MNDINQMFEAFHISDSDKESYDKFSNAFGNESIHHNKYEIKIIIVDDINNSISSKDGDNA